MAAHIAHGMLAGALAARHPLISFFLYIQFLAYEIIEALKIHDTAYIELREWSIGFTLGLAASLLLGTP